MSDQAKLGKLIDGAARRDAVYVAIAPVTASEQLDPGQEVGVTPEGQAFYLGNRRRGIGIVDPFLRKPVKKGERFWLCLYPGSITSLRHEWDHPAFPAKRDAVTESVE